MQLLLQPPGDGGVGALMVDAFSDAEVADLLKQAREDGRETHGQMGGRNRNPYRLAAEEWDAGWNEAAAERTARMIATRAAATAGDPSFGGDTLEEAGR